MAFSSASLRLGAKPQLTNFAILHRYSAKTFDSLSRRYPVVTDNDHETWRAYKVEAWPTIFVLDKSGFVRWKHVGEGAYEETERTIQKLLAEDGKSAETPKDEKVGMTDKVEKTDDVG